MKTREVRLVARPQGWPNPEDFAIVDAETAPLEDGEVLVRNLFMSVDPYMRGRMNDVKSYVPPFRLNETMTGGAVGEVVESRHPGLGQGDVVLHDLGWREHAVGPGKRFRRLDPIEGVPLSSPARRARSAPSSGRSPGSAVRHASSAAPARRRRSPT
jgi:NADPH-dependent curcumin reductase CurA